MLAARRTTLLSVAGLLGLSLFIALLTHADHGGPIPYISRGAVGGTLLFAITGMAAAARLTPAPLRPVWPILSLPAGAVLGSLALTVFGFAAVPLKVSLWLVLALGVAAWWRWGHRKAPRIDWWALVPWVVAGVMAFLIAALPVFRLDETSIFGFNPDSHQVVGSAELLKDAPPWATREGYEVNVVPSAWRFRYPILYAIAGVSNLSKFDPIFVFPALSALLVALAGLGLGALAVLCLRSPLGAAPWLAMTAPLNATVLHMTWHPYYNQLWGLALLPWGVAMGWWAVRERSRAAGIAFAGLLVMLALAYSLVVFYPLLVFAAMAWAHRLPRPRLPRPRGALQWLGAAVVGVLLLIPLAGAASKIGQGLRSVFDPHAELWGGDIFEFTPLGEFVGVGHGVVGAVAVLAVAAVAARWLAGRREALGLLVVLAVCALFDVRLRISDRGQYMDYKHLGYVGAIVVAFAGAGAVAAVLSRRRALVAGGVALIVAWLTLAIVRVEHEAVTTPEQVTADMLLLREWKQDLPENASIRIDIPATGVQLWAQYMLAGKRLGALYPVLKSTYAHMPFSIAGDYVLTPRYYSKANVDHLIPWPRPPHSGPIIRESYSFILRELHMPYPPIFDQSSKLMVQP